MLFCETAKSDAVALDTLAVFLSQVRAAGLPAVVHRQSLPRTMDIAHRYDLSAFVTDASPARGDNLLVLAAEDVDVARLQMFRRLYAGATASCIALGRFETETARIGTAAKLSYALGFEPEFVETDEIRGIPYAGAPLFSVETPRRVTDKPVVAICFPDEEKIEPLRLLALARDFQPVILTTGKHKPTIKKALGGEMPVWHPGEVLPRALASRIDVAVLCRPPGKWYRFQSLIADLVSCGSVLIDATSERAWSGLWTAIIPGTSDPVTLKSWLQQEILPRRDALGQETQGSDLARRLVMPPALRRLAAPSPRFSASPGVPETPGRIVFMPTNGVGLGHARRCSLVAREMSQPERVTFAAFPSCLKMLNNAGFDAMPLVSRTAERPGNANDLVNHSRIDALCADAAGLVFDGGYVFDSVLRTAADNGVPAVWIRRGLWQATQDNSVSLDRQKIFQRIIVPAEAFEELNAPVRGDHMAEVGPIVHASDLGGNERDEVRDGIRDRSGLDREKIVITMLGAGVAADRRAQVNTIAAYLSRRSDVLNLIVVWPTATIDPSWNQHRNSVVVRCHHASVLASAADVYISAVGYNSFHEAIYGRIPTIFIPQMASFMDDQRARAQAAADRDLALLVEPWQPMRLLLALDELLEGRAGDLRDRLARLNLPTPGNAAAARYIEELCN